MREHLQLIEKLSLLAFLVSSMFATGLRLRIRTLVAPLFNLRMVVSALVLNFVLSPALAWAVGKTLGLENGHIIGMLLLSGAAGAPFLPKLVETARADAATGAALMVLLTIGTIFYVPFVLPHIIPGFVSGPWEIARPLVLMIMAPMAAGMVVQWWVGAASLRVATVLGLLGNVFLLFLFVMLIVVNWQALLGVLGSGAFAAAILYVGGLFMLSWFAGRFAPQEKGVIALATAARNFGAALVPAANCFSDPAVTIMIIVSAVVGLAGCFAAAAWVRSREQPA